MIYGMNVAGLQYDFDLIHYDYNFYMDELRGASHELELQLNFTKS